MTKFQLDRMGCTAPDCKHENDDKLYFHGRCHPNAAVEALYTKETGEIWITCAVCHTMIAQVAVA